MNNPLEMVRDYFRRWRKIDFTADDWREQSDRMWRSFCWDWDLENEFLEPEIVTIPDQLVIAINEAFDSLNIFVQSVAASIASAFGIPAEYFDQPDSSARQSYRDLR